MKTNRVIISEEEAKICKIDGKVFPSSRLMLSHVKSQYKLTFEDYIIKEYYSGNRPVCLKTGAKLFFKPNKLGPWFSDYTKNCFPRKLHSEKTKQKIKEGCEKRSMELYGVKNPFQSDVVKDKIKKTNIDRYGVENPMQSKLFKRYEPRTQKSIDKGKNTNMKKYGMVTYSSTPAGKLQIKLAHFRRNHKTWEDYQGTLKKSYLEIISTESEFSSSSSAKFKCGIDNTEWLSEDTFPHCPKCESEHRDCRSRLEQSFLTFIDILGIKYEKNKRFDGTYELDVWIADKNIGIELNGLFWHSEANGKGKKYHINKLEFFNKRGIRIIQIMEDEWIYKTEVISAKIRNILGISYSSDKKIYARKCIVKNITNKETIEFIENNHIQGYSPSSYCYGAYYNGELVSVMTFSRPRIALGKYKKGSLYEIVRFCVKSGHQITGIFGKFVKMFCSHKNPEKLISYADRRFSDVENNIYTKNNFTLTGISSPGYCYVKGYKRLHRFKFQKNKLVKEGYDSSLTEQEIMKQRNYNKLWDCGQFRFEKIIKSIS